jgi:hypothetical protein
MASPVDNFQYPGIRAQHDAGNLVRPPAGENFFFGLLANGWRPRSSTLNSS